MGARVMLCSTWLAIISFCCFSRTVCGQVISNSNEGRGADGLWVLQEKARDGDARAMYLLGWNFMTGTNATQDYREAARWYGEAASKG